MNFEGLKNWKVLIINFADYKKYKKSSLKDPTISILSEKNNMYRTFISMIVIVFIIKIYEYSSITLTFLNEYNKSIFFIFLLILFLFSYKKQTNYIFKRVTKAN